MFQAAQRIGRAIRTVHDIDGEALEAADVKFDVSFLFGGQIKGERMRLFMIYSAGNFIECTVDTPYLQIGEHKYGKPMLDRAINYDIDLYDALKIGLISMDSTMRSNLGVGMPIDMLVVRRDACERRNQLPHRAGRALFSRPARALVGGAARRARRNSPAALHNVFRGTGRTPPPHSSPRHCGAPCLSTMAIRGQHEKIAVVTGAGSGSAAPRRWR